MKLLLLKILLQRRAEDEGYVLPMVIAIGLVMVLLGAVNLTSAKEESFNAITQNSRSDALGIAEVGVARYRELLDRNRILTVYNRNRWTSNNVNGVDVAGQTCDVITDTANGWASNELPGTAFSAANWRAVTADESVVGRDLNDDGDATDNGVNIGWYKIVDYEYDIDGALGGTDNDAAIDATDDDGNFSLVRDIDPTHPAVLNPSVDITTGVVTNTDNDVDNDGNSDARGILTVKGRTPDGSEAQIEVEIPIRINDLNNFAPVLWIGNGAITTPGTLNFPNDATDNVVMANVPSSLTGCPTNPPIAGITNFINDPREIPPVIANPSSVAATNKNNLGTVTTNGGRLRLPRSNATPDNRTANGERFLYEINGLTITNNDFVTDGIAKVSLYVNNTFNITNTGGTLRVGNFNFASSNVSSHNLEIYVDSSVGQINIDTGGVGDEIQIEALIHAPNSTLSVTGSGDLTINGALWIADINNTSTGTVTIQGDRTDTTTGIEPSYKFYTTSANRSPRPLTSSPTTWKTEEVN